MVLPFSPNLYSNLAYSLKASCACRFVNFMILQFGDLYTFVMDSFTIDLLRIPIVGKSTTLLSLNSFELKVLEPISIGIFPIFPNGNEFLG
jgi:hypothetical protein